MEKETEKTSEIYNAPNLEKGMLILELLATSSKSMNLNEITKASRISQTTAYRILLTLVRLGYLLYDESSKRYKLSRKMLTIGFHAIQEQNQLDVVLPKMRELRDIVKETVFFGVMGEEKGLFIEQILGTHPFCFVLTPGKLFELHCSAPGKAMMAFLPEVTRDFFLSKMEFQKYNANTIQSKDAYLKELASVKEKGYAVDMEEELSGVVCLGAPIFNYMNVPCGAIWISGPKDRLPDETIQVFSGMLMAVTQSISFELGYKSG
jgi:DNA-binding IclR family transcriptional regulator